MTLAESAPAHARNVDEAVATHGAVGRAWVQGLWEGDGLADAFVADMLELGRAAGMRMFRTAIDSGIASVDSPPESLVALFTELDAVPPWVDFAQLDRAGDHIARNSLQLGLVLAAGSLMVGYTNPAAAYPLILTGRLVDHAGMRNLEVGDWLREVTTPGGMRRDGLGFQRTVRVRVIHAMVRRHVASRPEWDAAVLGTPISQPYMAHTLSEFGSIAVSGMDLLGARYSDGELSDIYALWRYVGHLSGVSEALLPVDEAGQRAIQELYQLTRPPVDDRSRALVAGLVNDYLVPEVAELLPARMPGSRSVATAYVNGLIRAVIGDALADELGIDESRFKHVVPVLGHATATLYGGLQRLPGGTARRTARGRRYSAEQEQRLRAKYAMVHDLVDASPSAD
jgi:hypothetical protein